MRMAGGKSFLLTAHLFFYLLLLFSFAFDFLHANVDHRLHRPWNDTQFLIATKQLFKLSYEHMIVIHVEWVCECIFNVVRKIEW